MSNVQRLTLSSILIALGVLCSTFYIPIGVAKCFPIQHLINVLAGVLLGPIYAVAMAFITSLLRLFMGTGSLLAFPGSMCGALFCGTLYKYTKSIAMAFLGEVIGTGFIGAVLAYPIATLFMSRTVALFGFVIPFGLSSIGGAAISLVFIVVIKKTGIFNKLA
jgi:energy coupling factor transporter S component ThiW